MYVSQHVFLSFHSVLMFRFASSIKENGNWLSKTTLEEVGCRSDADSIYPESHFWVVAAGAAGRYSCPVATMFCEKLLTRRDIAENLRASVIGIRLSFCVVGIKRWKCFEATTWCLRKVSSAAHSMQAHSLERNSSPKKFLPPLKAVVQIWKLNILLLTFSFELFHQISDIWKGGGKLTISECQSSRFASMVRLRARMA